MAGVVLDLLANPADMHVDRALVADKRVIPEPLEQLVAREHLAGVLHKEVQQLERPGLERQQAIGTPKGRAAGAQYLRDFVAETKASGFVAELIERHGARGLSVAPAA